MAQSIFDYVQRENEGNIKKRMEASKPLFDFMQKAIDVKYKKEEEEKVRAQNIDIGKQRYFALTGKNAPDYDDPRMYDVDIEKIQKQDKDRQYWVSQAINNGIDHGKTNEEIKAEISKIKEKSRSNKETLFGLNVEAKKKNLADEETTLSPADQKIYNQVKALGYDADAISNDINYKSIVKTIQKKPEYEKLVSAGEAWQKEFDAKMEEVKKKYNVKDGYYWKPTTKKIYDKNKEYKENFKKTGKKIKGNLKYFQRFSENELIDEAEFEDLLKKQPDEEKLKEAQNALSGLEKYKVGGKEKSEVNTGGYTKDEIVNGYQYLGGDYSNKDNWKKVK